MPYTQVLTFDEAIGATQEIIRQLELLEDSTDKRRNLLGAYYMLQFIFEKLGAENSMDAVRLALAKRML